MKLRQFFAAAILGLCAQQASAALYTLSASGTTNGAAYAPFALSAGSTDYELTLVFDDATVGTLTNSAGFKYVNAMQSVSVRFGGGATYDLALTGSFISIHNNIGGWPGSYYDDLLFGVSFVAPGTIETSSISVHFQSYDYSPVASVLDVLGDNLLTSLADVDFGNFEVKTTHANSGVPGGGSLGARYFSAPSSIITATLPVSEVPEPASSALCGLALTALVVRRKRTSV